MHQTNKAVDKFSFSKMFFVFKLCIGNLELKSGKKNKFSSYTYSTIPEYFVTNYETQISKNDQLYGSKAVTIIFYIILLNRDR